MDTTIAAFELSIQETGRWLDDIQARLGVSRPAALAALRATLTVLRGQLPVEVSTRFANQMPAILATIYLSGPSSGGPGKDRIGDQIGDRLPPAVSLDGETVGRSVLKAIRSRIGLTEFRKVLAYLPRHVREQWLDDYVCADAGDIAAARMALGKPPAHLGANQDPREFAARLHGWIGLWGAALGRTAARGSAIVATLEFRNPVVPLEDAPSGSSR